MLLLYDFEPISRLAIKRSRFKIVVMNYKWFKNTVFVMVFVLLSCGNGKTQNDSKSKVTSSSNTVTVNLSKTKKRGLAVRVGANQTESYIPTLKGQSVALVSNQTSVVFKKLGYIHLVDTLLSRNINIKKVFAPEHGFRGTADAGETIKDAKDTKTGLPIISLYGENKKPTAEQLSDVDIVVFDIQDVGARFYTYISTLHYVMEACAENNKTLLVLDRPNPNGHYIDGPILEPQHQSFVGMHPVPVVHGMTIGEYASMINGQGWLTDQAQVDLTVIPVENYAKNMAYALPIKPSPNLPNHKAVNLYPSLCFFEGTNVNAGRGTSKQFQVFGSPYLNSKHFNFSYTPQPNKGSKFPKHRDKICYGRDLSLNYDRLDKISLEYLIEAYRHTKNPDDFFNSFFTKLAGTKRLQQQIEARTPAETIIASWQKDLKQYDAMRKAYELYPRQ